MNNSVEHNDLSRSHLETLTSSQLIELADKHGIEIPEDLNRQFIIAELLDYAKDIADNLNFEETIKVSEDVQQNVNPELSKTYNETFIDVVLRNPVSLFVVWEVSSSQKKQIELQKNSIRLQVCFFEDLSSETPEDTLDIQIDYEDREQNILIPGGKKVVRVGLIQNTTNMLESVLAVSNKILIPQCPDEYRNFQPGKELKIDPILELSGIKTILKNHYNNYRQSFN